MEQLARLRARITSLTELRDLVRALRALAASHIQEAQGSLAGIRRYVEVVEDAIAAGAMLLARAPADAATPGVDAGVMLVVCSEHGFVGGFNERLLEHAAAGLAPGQRLAVVGRKGVLTAAERAMEVHHSFAMATHMGGILATTREIAESLAASSVADAVFARYRRGGGFDVERRRILPLDPALLAKTARRGPPLHQLAPDMLLDRLASEYLFAEITRMVTESLASENGARLAVMEAADHNIGDKLDKLAHEQRSLRQAAITEELLDVVTGSEAIIGPGRWQPRPRSL